MAEIQNYQLHQPYGYKVGTQKVAEETKTEVTKEETEEVINIQNSRSTYTYEPSSPIKSGDYTKSSEFYGKDKAFFTNEVMAEIEERLAIFPCNVSESGIVTQLDEFPGKYGHNYYVFVCSEEIPNTDPTEYRWHLDTKIVVKPDEPNN